MDPNRSRLGIVLLASAFGALIGCSSNDSPSGADAKGSSGAAGSSGGGGGTAGDGGSSGAGGTSAGPCVPEQCPGAGNPCATTSCDSSGQCVSQPLADGVACDDNNACTLQDSCVAGTCVGSKPVDSFLPKVDYPAGGEAVAVVAADFNGDDKPDLLVVNDMAESASILLNQGDGSFGAPAAYPAGIDPRSAAVADVNKDGKIDFVVGDYAGHTFFVYLNQGQGTFLLGSNVGSVQGPTSCTPADFDGDGSVDLAMTTSPFAVQFGVGGSSPAPPDTYDFGNSMRVVSGDLNGDHLPDLAVANDVEPGGSLCVALNQGAGKFGPDTCFTTGDGARSLAEADFNGDGVLDVVTGNQADNSISVLLNDGVGTFNSHVEYSNVVIGLYTVAAGDLNADGKPDIVTNGFNQNIVNVWLNNGDGSFSQRTPYPTGVSPYEVTVADFNGDGLGDIASANGDGTVSILLNAGCH